MKPSVLIIEGIDCWSFHGCMPEETTIGGSFSVDVIIEMDMQKAIEKDDLSATADYTLIHNLVREEMGIPSKLVEAVAGRILNKISSVFPQAINITVRVIKLNPPVNGRINRVMVEVKK